MTYIVLATTASLALQGLALLTATVHPAPHAEPLVAGVCVVTALDPDGTSLADRDRGCHLAPAAAKRPDKDLSCGGLSAGRAILPLGCVAEQQLVESRGDALLLAAATDNHPLRAAHLQTIAEACHGPHHGFGCRLPQRDTP